MVEHTPVTVVTGVTDGIGLVWLNRAVREPSPRPTLVLADRVLADRMAAHPLLEIVEDRPTPPWSGGCVCCAPRGGASGALRRVLPKARRGEIGRVVVVRGGMDDGLPILAALMSDPVLASVYRLDQLVTVLTQDDRVALAAGSANAARRVAVADRIVDPGSLRGLLPGINPDAPLPGITGGTVPMDGLCGMASSARTEQEWQAFHAMSGIGAMQVTVNGGRDERSVRTWLEAFSARHGARLLRLKGRVPLRRDRRVLAMEAVGHVWQAAERPLDVVGDAGWVTVVTDGAPAPLHAGLHALGRNDGRT